MKLKNKIKLQTEEVVTQAKNKKNKYLGSDFDDFLKEQGLLEEIEIMIANVDKKSKN